MAAQYGGAPANYVKVTGPNVKMIPVDEKLVDNLNPKMRAEFFQNWKKALRGEG